MKTDSNNKKVINRIFEDTGDIVALCVTTALFAYFAVAFDVVEYGDSFQYLHQYPMREPVYALLLQVLTCIFKDGYTVALGLFQNILAIVCIFWTFKRIGKILELKPLFRIGTLVVLLAPHILTPLASQSHMVLTNGVVTEGICLSLYYVWMTMLIGILTDYYEDTSNTKAIWINLALGLVLALTRGQMVLCLILWIIVVTYKSLREKQWKKIVLYLVILAVSMVFKTQFTKIYNLAETGYYVNTVSSKPMLLANIVYVCDEQDADYIEEEDLREAFRGIVKKAEENGLTRKFATGGIISQAEFHESGHEELNFNYIDPAIREVLDARYGLNASKFLELMICEDELCGQIAKEILPDIAGKYISNYLVIVSLGMVRSIAVEKSILPLYAIFMYILAVILTAIFMRKDIRSREGLTMILVLLTICGTVFGTSLMIQCITRYMIYNLPFFYIAGMAMVQRCLRKS